MSLGAGGALAAVHHPAADEFLLLRHPFRADLPHRELRRDLRHPADLAAVSIYSVEGLAGLGGRVAFGVLGDRFGAKRVLVLGLLVQAFGALAYVFARELAASTPSRRCSASSMPASCRFMPSSRARISR